MKKLILVILLIIGLSLLIGYIFTLQQPDVVLQVHELPKVEPNDGDYPVLDEEYSDFLCEFENYFLKKKENSYVPGLAVAIVKKGKLIYKKGFGLRDYKNKYPVTTSTIFRVGSVSKGFAAGLAGLMENEGVIEWTNPINTYISNYITNPIEYADSLTVERVLSHSTGYQYQAYSTLIEDNIPLDTMLRSLQSLKLSRIPGEIHAYQNVAYSLIEKILENQTNCSFTTLMHDRIFEPLNMVDASIDYQSFQNKLNVALPHFSSRVGIRVGDVSSTYYNVKAAGGINANIDDMSKWLIAVMGYRPDVIPSQVLKEIFTPRIRTAVKNHNLSLLETPRKGYYGLGWRIIDYPSDTIIYHGGYVNGYKSVIGFSQTDDIGICILSNSGGSLTSSLIADFFEMYRPR